MTEITTNSRILIAGGGDVVEASLSGGLRARGFRALVSSTESGLNLLDRSSVNAFMDRERPQYVILSSVRSGSIQANRERPAEFIFENLSAQDHVIDAACRLGVKKFLFIAASCVYPVEAAQPVREESFLSGPMEKTSEPYSMAKAAGIVMCQAYRKQYGFPAVSAVPATVYGPQAERDVEEAHVLSALMAKFHRAVREGAGRLELWGSGRPRREFIYGDDLAEACLCLLGHDKAPELVNIGTGEDIEVRELARLIADVTGFKGEVVWDTSKPDGAMRKLLNTDKIRSLGWSPRVTLSQGIAKTYAAWRKDVF